jgi:HlyD family secretion protein
VRIATIEIGQRNSSFAEVKAGLTASATVVLHPSDRVADGARVTPIRT